MPANTFGVVAAISAAPGFSLGADAPETPGFSVVGETLARMGNLNEFIQWRLAGVDFGTPTVQVIDIIDTDGRLIVTRGTGENAHVLTIREYVAPVPPTEYLYFTSWLYSFEVIEPMDYASWRPSSGKLLRWEIESMDYSNWAPTTGTLIVVLHPYTFQLPELLDYSNWYPLSGTLVVVLHSQSQFPEPMDYSNWRPASGTLVVVLVQYTYQLTEPLDYVNFRPVSGTLV